MIEVTRLNGIPMIVNSDLIKIAEASPDTMLTLIHGEKLIVRESCAQIVEKVLAYRAQLLAAVATRCETLGMQPDLRRVAGASSLSSDQWAAQTGGPIPLASGERNARTVNIDSMER
jgi:uncharacterized protein YlzI (FlbEa/FlbD family)